MSTRSRAGFIARGLALFTSMLAGLGTIVGLHSHSGPTRKVDLQLHGQRFDSPSWERAYDDGDALYRAGKYDEAYRRWAECRVLAQEENALSQYEDARQIDVLKKLAIVYKTQQDPAGAANCYERAVAKASALYGKGDARVALLLLDLGRMYSTYDSIKNYNKSDELLREAFRINESLYGKYTIPTGDVAIALAQLKQSQCQYSQAAEFYALAVEIGNRLEPNIISCCRIGPRQGLAASYEKLGRFEEALAVHQELIEMAKAGAPSMLSTVTGSCAECLRKMGREEEARKVNEAATNH